MYVLLHRTGAVDGTGYARSDGWSGNTVLPSSQNKGPLYVHSHKQILQRRRRFLRVIRLFLSSLFSCRVPSADRSWARSAGMATSVPAVVGSLLPSRCIATEWTKSDN